MAEETRATQEHKWDDVQDEEVVPSDAWGESVYTGNVPGHFKTFLTKDEIVFGRNPNSDIVLQHNGASGKHCILRRMGKLGESILMLTDTSTNGTYVNNVKIGRNQQLEIKSGQEIVLVRTQTERITFIIRAFDQDKEHEAEVQHPNGPYHKYVIGHQLGSGAYATVKTCFCKETNNQFAIKVIDKRKFALSQGEGGGSRIYTTAEATAAAAAEHDAKLSQTLNAEVDILRSIDHSNVIKVFDVFETERYFYIVLELISGGDLLDFLLNNKRPFTEVEARPMFSQLIEATDYLHSKQIVHRDIKPENILVQPGSNNLKLTDFGLSRIVGEGSFMKTVCGTPQYLAPEVLKLAPMLAQRSGAPPPTSGYSKAVDLWSLGVILYVMLAAAQPFDENTMVDSILRGSFSFPADRWTGKSEHVKDLIRGLLTVDPEKRYTAEEVRNHPWMRAGQRPPPAVYAAGDAMTQSPMPAGANLDANEQGTRNHVRQAALNAVSEDNEDDVDQDASDHALAANAEDGGEGEDSLAGRRRRRADSMRMTLAANVSSSSDEKQQAKRRRP